MFLNYIKNFFTQKTVKKSLSNVKHAEADQKIKTIGIIFDESYFYEKDALVQELIGNGIDESQISILVFKNKTKKK